MNTSASYISAAAQFSPGAPLGLVVQMMLSPVKHRHRPTVRHLIASSTHGDNDFADVEVIPPKERHGTVEYFNKKALARFAPMQGKGQIRPRDVAILIGLKYDDVNKQLRRMAGNGLIRRIEINPRSPVYEWIEQ